jgi:hypothetical protein
MQPLIMPTVPIWNGITVLEREPYAMFLLCSVKKLANVGP